MGKNTSPSTASRWKQWYLLRKMETRRQAKMEVLENLSLLPRAERLKTIREQMSVGWQIYIAAANDDSNAFASQIQPAMNGASQA